VLRVAVDVMWLSYIGAKRLGKDVRFWRVKPALTQDRFLGLILPPMEPCNCGASRVNGPPKRPVAVADIGRLLRDVSGRVVREIREHSNN
jgi:hypothetical protein